MRTEFTEQQLENPATAVAQAVIRKCVHCGFCTATCPTYVLLGDELDSPRGRIYLIKNMLEEELEPTADIVKHVDRCLSCLSCMTTCPSGVNYMHLVDHARAYIEQRYRRPLAERLIRSLLAAVLPYPRRFRAALALARLFRPTAPLIEQIPVLRPIAAMLRLAPRQAAARPSTSSLQVTAATGRVLMLQGCAEPVLKPQIRTAAIRLLNRLGYDVAFAAGEQCCGALVHHMGREDPALRAARHNIDAWRREIEAGDIAAILITASGCGTTVKNYGFLLRDDPDYAEIAAHISSLAKDISEFLDGIDLPDSHGHGMTIAYHAACSLQHGQQVTDAPKKLLARAGYSVRTPLEAHLCCGSAGTYNILQRELAGKLGDRKVANIERLKADVIATGNIGCTMQIGLRTRTPVVHIVELLDWATGGPPPPALGDTATSAQERT